MSGVPQFMEGDPLENAELLLAGVVDVSPRLDGSVSRGEWADLEVALAEIRRAEKRCEECAEWIRRYDRMKAQRDELLAQIRRAIRGDGDER